jgi:hypothetical protein
MEVLLQGAVNDSAIYPHQGEIRTSRLSLDDRYRQYSDDRSAFITAEQADVIVTHDFPTTPPVLWDWLNDPYKRTRWLRWTKWRPGIRPSGRTDVGAVNHCAHGVGTIIETILDWRPYSYFTVEMEQASLRLSILATYQLEPLPNGAGTRLFLCTILQKAPALSLSRQVFKSGFPRKMKQDFQRMEALMAAAAGASGSPMPESTPITETAGS